MKIVNIISRLSPYGGAQSVCLTHIEYQLRENFEVIFISANNNENFTKSNFNKVLKINLNFLINFKLIDWIKDVYFLYKFFKKEKPEFIITHSTVAGIIGRLFGFFLSIKTIHTFHGFNTARKPFFGFLFINIQRLFKFITFKAIYVCEHDYKFAKNKNFLVKNSCVIYNTIGLDTEIKKDFNHDLENDKTNFIMVARHSEQKDHKNLLDAIKLLDDKNYRVDLVGGGELFKQNLKYAEDLNILDKVNFIGEISNVSDLLPHYDCGVLISNMEGLPVSIIEYMKSELLVISSDVGGCNELVKDNLNGFLLKENNPKEIALALQKVVQKKCNVEAMKKQSKFLFDQLFSKEIFFSNLDKKQVYKP